MRGVFAASVVAPCGARADAARTSSGTQMYCPEKEHYQINRFFFHASRYFLVSVQVSLAVGEISLFVFLSKNIQGRNEIVRKNLQEHLNHLSK